MTSAIEPGTYRHYKGGLYEVEAIATHTESGESLVVYRSVSDGVVWVRPVAIFDEWVAVGAKLVRRFERVRAPARVAS